MKHFHRSERFLKGKKKSYRLIKKIVVSVCVKGFFAWDPGCKLQIDDQSQFLCRHACHFHTHSYLSLFLG